MEIEREREEEKELLKCTCILNFSPTYHGYSSLFLSLSFIGDQSDPNIDEDLMREYEEFVQDFEDHLMMQEFGQT